MGESLDWEDAMSTSEELDDESPLQLPTKLGLFGAGFDYNLHTVSTRELNRKN
jgi:hypothetical protein